MWTTDLDQCLTQHVLELGRAIDMPLMQQLLQSQQ